MPMSNVTSLSEADYIQLRNQILKDVENVGFSQTGVHRPAGERTIGYGWNIEAHTADETVAALAAAGITLTPDQLTALQGFVSSTQSVTDAQFITAWSGFVLTETEATDMLNHALVSYESALTAALGVHDLDNSQERAAFLSQIYSITNADATNITNNFPTLIGIISRITSDTESEIAQRFDAWYEITFNANSISNPDLKGIQNRRIAEGELFGLYSGVNNTPSPDDFDFEAKRVMQLLDVKNTGDALEAYLDDRGFSPSEAKVTIDGIYLPAHLVLISNYYDDIYGTATPDNVTVIVDAMGVGGTITGDQNPSAPNDLVFGEELGDTIDVGNGVNTAYGGDGDDTLIGGTGADTLYGDGALGDASVQGDDTLIGNKGNDRLIGGAGNDTLYGGDGDDSLYGDGSFTNGVAGNDILYGEKGNDYIYGEAGSDTIDGGLGFDTIFYGGFLATGLLGSVNVDGKLEFIKTVNAGEGNATYTDTLTGVEKVIGSEFGDVFAENAESNIFYGMEGDDTFEINFNNQLEGTLQYIGPDFFYGGAGSNTLVIADTVLYEDTIPRYYEGGALIADLSAGFVGHVANGSMVMADGVESLPIGSDINFRHIMHQVEEVNGIDYYALLGQLDDSSENKVSSFKNITIAHPLSAPEYGAAQQGVNVLYIYGDDQDNTFTFETGYYVIYLQTGPGADTIIIDLDKIGSADAGGLALQIFDPTNEDTIIFIKDGEQLTANPDTFEPSSLGGYLDDSNPFLFQINQNTDYKYIDGEISEILPGYNYFINLSTMWPYPNGGAWVDMYFYDPGDFGFSFGPFPIEGPDTYESYIIREPGIPTISPIGKHESAWKILGDDNGNALFGTEGNDTIDGAGGDDNIYAGPGDDTVNGGTGNDTITAGSGEGDDIYDGGDDIDWLVYPSTTLGVSVDLVAGIATGDEINTDTLMNIENVAGGRGDDTLSGSDVTNELQGSDGNDFIYGLGGADILTGGRGNDALYGGDGDDLIIDRSWEDSYYGTSGSDTYNGGTGTDTIDYSASAAGVSLSLVSGGTAGDATGDAFTDVENIVGTAFNDVIVGDDNDNQINAGGGDDLITGDGGNDSLTGGDGSDVFSYGLGWGSDTITDFASGIDAIDFTSTLYQYTDLTISQVGADVLIADGIGNDVLLQNILLANISETDFLFGIPEVPVNQTITGTASGDTLVGGLGNDTISGLSGDDHITGNGGNDFIDGGAGSDTYVFNLGDGQDIISDGNYVETIAPVVAIVDQGDATAYTFNGGASQTDGVLNFVDGSGLKLGRAPEFFSMPELTLSFDVQLDKDYNYLGEALVYNHTHYEVSVSNDKLYVSVTTTPDNGLTTVRSTITIVDAGLRDGRWHNVSFSYDGTTGELFAYVDDVERGSITGLSGRIADNNGHDLYLGQSPWGGHLDGQIDNFLMWSSADVTPVAAGAADTIELGAGITLADLTFDVVGNNLVISIQGTSDSITVENYYIRVHEIEKLVLATGEVYDLDTIIPVTSGDDIIVGTVGDDTLVGKGGDDQISGDAGQDTAVFSGSLSDYQFMKNGTLLKVLDTRADGDGLDTLSGIEFLQFEGDGQLISFANLPLSINAYDYQSSTYFETAVTFDPRINDSDPDGDGLVISSVNDGANGIVSINASGTLTYTPNETFYGSDSFTYTVADNAGNMRSATVNVDVQQLLGTTPVMVGSAIHGTSGSDVLYGGSSSNDLMAGLEDNDWVFGGGAHDAIAGNAGNDRLYGEDGSDRLYGADGDDALFGGAGNDELSGGAGSDALNGGSGDDLMSGGIGNDTYYINQGDGQDIIRDGYTAPVFSLTTDAEFQSYTATGGVSVVEGTAYFDGTGMIDLGEPQELFGMSDLSFSVTFTQDAAAFALNPAVNDGAALLWNHGRYMVKFADEGDGLYFQVITDEGGLYDMFISNLGLANSLEHTVEVSYDSSTGILVLLVDDVEVGRLTGVIGDIQPPGPWQAMVGGTIWGNGFTGAISDVRVWDTADGASLNTTSNIDGGNDTLILGSGISLEDISFSTVGNDLIIQIGTAGDTVTIEGFTAQENKIETVQFADGYTLDLSTYLEGTLGDINNNLLAADDTGQILIGSDGNDEILGGYGNDTIDGGVGNDTLIGNAGDDSYLFGLGDGQDTILDHDQLVGDAIVSYVDDVDFAGLTFSGDAGYSGGALTFGGNGYVNLGKHPDFFNLDQLYLSLDFKAALGQTGTMILLNNHGWFNIKLTGDKIHFSLVTDTGDTVYATYTVSGINDGNWHNAGLAYDSSTGLFIALVDGQEVGRSDGLTGGVGVPRSWDVNLGGFDIYDNFTGEIDNVRLWHTLDDLTGAVSNYRDNGAADEIVLDAGILPSDVTIVESGDDLIIQIGLSGDTITIPNFVNSADRVEYLKFADGTIWSLVDYHSGAVAPVIFDLTGNGLSLIEASESSILFDADNDGVAEHMGWVAGQDDAILALDRNGDGVINSATEISFVQDLEGATTDMEGLAAYDSNSDGILDGQDAGFGEFLLWRDANLDGISQASELSSLSDMGIASISLSLTPTGEVFDHSGNTVINNASFTYTDGAVGTVHDVMLGYEEVIESDPQNSFWMDNVDILSSWSSNFHHLMYKIESLNGQFDFAMYDEGGVVGHMEKLLSNQYNFSYESAHKIEHLYDVGFIPSYASVNWYESTMLSGHSTFNFANLIEQRIASLTNNDESTTHIIVSSGTTGLSDFSGKENLILDYGRLDKQGSSNYAVDEILYDGELKSEFVANYESIPQGVNLWNDFEVGANTNTEIHWTY